MVYGVMRLINFAHASIFMAGSMFAWFILKTSNIIGERSFESASIQLDETQKILVWIIISVGAALFAATLGVTIERIAYRPLRKASRLSIVISAMAAGMVIDNVAMVLSGGSVKGFPNLIPEIQFNVAGAYITGIQIFIVMLTIIILAALWLLVYRTYFGCAIRALSEDYEAAALMGVNVNNVIRLVFFIGTALAGISAVLYSMYYGQSSFFMGVQVGNRAWIAAVIGGIGSIEGTVIGALVLGIFETIGAGYLPVITGGAIGSQYSRVFALILLILVLIFRPQGLIGERIKERS